VWRNFCCNAVRQHCNRAAAMVIGIHATIATSPYYVPIQSVGIWPVNPRRIFAPHF
jgi:hypothetical protein